MNAINLIKISFLKSRLAYFIQTNRPIFDQLNKSTTNYDQLVSCMMDKNIIKNMKMIVDRYVRLMQILKIDDIYVNNATDKKMLTIWMISAFPHYVLNDKISESKNVFSIANDLVILLSTNDIQTFKFCNLFKRFCKSFDSFLILDKKAQINELIQKWYDDEIAKEEIMKSIKYNAQQKIQVLKTIDTGQNKIKKYITNMDKSFDLDLLVKYKELYDGIAKNTKQAYWDMLVTELDNKNFTMLTDLLNEIKINLIQIAPKYESEFEQLFNVTIDENFDFLYFANLIIEKIIFLQAPIKNEDTNHKWNILKIKFNENNNLSLAIANGVKFIIEQLFDIKSDIYELMIVI